MRASRVTAGSLLFLVFGCATASPPGPESLVPGTRVRASYPSPSAAVLTGRIDRHVLGSLDLVTEPDGVVQRIALGDLEKLEVNPGRASRRSILIGASIGMLGGLVAGMACSSACVSDDSNNGRFIPIAGAAAGAALGAGIGLVLAPEAWFTIDLRLLR